MKNRIISGLAGIVMMGLAESSCISTQKYSANPLPDYKNWPIVQKGEKIITYRHGHGSGIEVVREYPGEIEYKGINMPIKVIGYVELSTPEPKEAPLYIYIELGKNPDWKEYDYQEVLVKTAMLCMDCHKSVNASIDSAFFIKERI